MAAEDDDIGQMAQPEVVALDVDDEDPEVEGAQRLDEQAGERTSGIYSGHRNEPKTKNAFGNFELQDEKPASYGDSGGASRFFYTSKASRADRGTNAHPTVKPSALMRWLVKLVTPPGGLVLDPFTGSGTTGLACVCEGFDFIGFEQDEAHVETARRRIHDEAPLLMVEAAP